MSTLSALSHLGDLSALSHLGDLGDPSAVVVVVSGRDDALSRRSARS